MIDISDCLLKSVGSYSAGGGAVSIVAPRMLVRLRSSRFLDCGSFGDGGALFAGSLSQLTESVVFYIEQSHFVECKSDRGQGGAVSVKSPRLANVTIKNSDFVLTSASGYGGALTFVIPKAAMNLANKDFQGGGENFIRIESSRFVNSTTFVPGGAIFIDFVTEETKITLKNATFANNNAGGPGGGLASMRLGSGDSRVGSENSITIESSRFFDNTALYPPGGSTAELNLTIKHTLFKNNSAGGPGGAISAVKASDKNV